MSQPRGCGGWENTLSRRESRQEGLKGRAGLACLISSKSNWTLEQGKPEETGGGTYPQRSRGRSLSHL